MSEPILTPLPQQIVIQQPKESAFGRYGKWLLVALAFCIMSIIGLTATYQSYFSDPNGPTEKFHSLSRTATKKIAIIEVSGAIMEGDEFVKQQIDRVKEDDNVVGVVLRVNSPGGTVTYSDYLLHHLRELRKEKDNLPLVVSMGSVAASGGYYVSMAVGDQPQSIYAEPTTWTGSIGVIIPHYNFSRSMAMLSIMDDSIASGPMKQMGSPTKPMTKEERAVLQELVDESFAGFKEVVLSGRPKLKEQPETLAKATTGQIFTAGQALELGLVDKLGFIEEAIERVAELAEVSTDNVRCVQFEKRTSPLAALLGASTHTPHTQGFDLRALLDLSTPRPYYLWTVLPSLLE